MTPPDRERLLHLRCCALDDERAPSLLAEPQSRVLHFIRHGEATHQLRALAEAERGNICRCDDPQASQAERCRCPYLDPALEDAPLTERGREQVRSSAGRCAAQIVLAAPTRRSLQTALDAFAGSTIPVIALDDLRARISAHAHSRRSTVSQLSGWFPQVDFSAVLDEQDLAWSPVTESRRSLDRRASSFLRIACARPEKQVAVVTHFTTLLALLQQPGDPRFLGANPERQENDPPLLDLGDDPNADARRGYLQTGELRSLVVVPGAGA